MIQVEREEGKKEEEECCCCCASGMDIQPTWLVHNQTLSHSKDTVCRSTAVP
jgi:hypothetical protein